ncbi:hypothetical protein [Streptomyces sp. NPDC049916]
MAAADRALFDLAIPLFGTQDAKDALASAAAALREGGKCPGVDFQGN